jgi:hypothetical protein
MMVSAKTQAYLDLLCGSIAIDTNPNQKQPPQTRVTLAQFMHHVTQQNRDPLAATNISTAASRQNHCAGMSGKLEQSDH